MPLYNVNPGTLPNPYDVQVTSSDTVRHFYQEAKPTATGVGDRWTKLNAPYDAQDWFWDGYHWVTPNVQAALQGDKNQTATGLMNAFLIPGDSKIIRLVVGWEAGGILSSTNKWKIDLRRNPNKTPIIITSLEVTNGDTTTVNSGSIFVPVDSANGVLPSLQQNHKLEFYATKFNTAPNTVFFCRAEYRLYHP